MNRSRFSSFCCSVFSGLLLLALASGCQSSTSETTSDSGDGGATETTDAGDSDAADNGDSASSDSDAGSSADESATALFIDVRTQDEWDAGHLEQAIHIPHEQIGDKISDVAAEKDRKIIVYCAVGGRAGRAKETLEGLGYTNVENGGGLDDVKARFENK